MRRADPVSPPPAAAAGRPGGPGLPAPRALCYSPTSCLPPPDPGSFPGRGSRRRPRVSRRLPLPLGSASRTPESRPGPGSRRAAVKAPGLCTRGRCEAIGAAHRWGPPAPPDPGSALLCPGAHGTSQGAAAGCEFSFRPCPAELPPGLESLSRVNSRTLFPKYTSGCPESPGPFTYSESSQQPALSPPPDFSSPGIPGLWHPE